MSGKPPIGSSATSPTPVFDDEHCPAKADESHCVHWWDGEPCCACKAPAMTREQKIAQGMEVP